MFYYFEWGSLQVYFDEQFLYDIEELLWECGVLFYYFVGFGFFEFFIDFYELDIDGC